MRNDISANYVRSIIEYDPETGILTRIRNDASPRYRNAVPYKTGYVNAEGYVIVSIDRKPYMAHRLAYLIMTGEWPDECIDHVNHDKADNRWSNIRPATLEQNCWNKKPNKRNTTGFKGVTACGDAFKALIRINGKAIYLGRFKTVEEAGEAYRLASIAHHGEYSCA
ncbi:HNH endonuclease [Aureimonas altamirensis]|uniref:HNH endonuclease n=1 Tax=Aureimonas altamirensis TaxID=370622 RepID=UPI00203733A8|nr:HNH endonuclease [Aureimonas altamirensis]MCM2503903.1 HNH endonuclease [Aureimonas altamirensis]